MKTAIKKHLRFLHHPFKVPGKAHLFFLFFLISVSAHSQVFITPAGRQISGFKNMYKANSEAMYINPAGLGVLDTNHTKLHFFQPGFNSHSEVLDRETVNKLTFSHKEIGEIEKTDFLEMLKDEPLTFNTGMEINWLTFFAGSPKVGGISLAIREEIKTAFELDYSTVAFLLMGREGLEQLGSVATIPIPDRWNNGFINFRHYRSIDLGYGRSIFRNENTALYLGVGVNKLFGMGYLDHAIEANNSLGQATFSEFYTIKFADFETGGDWVSKLTSSVGSGMAYNGGVIANFRLNESSLIIGASLLNVGSIKWKRKIINAKTQTLHIGNDRYQTGLESYNFEDQIDYLFEAFNYEKADDIIIKEKLPGQIRINGIYDYDNNLMFNLDLLSDLGSTAFKNKQTAVVASLGWTPLKDYLPVRLNSGLLFHTEYKVRVPFGISFQLGSRITALSISTNDLITLFNPKNNPLTSLSISFIGIEL